MKKMLFLLLLSAFCFVTCAQRLDTASRKNMSDRDLGMYYLKKNKNQK